MASFDLSKLKLIKNENVRMLTAMVTDVIKWHWRRPVSKMSRSRLSRQGHVGMYFYYSENLNWAAQNLRLGGMRAAGWT